MSVAEILEELPKLSAEEREAVARKLGEIRGRPASAGPGLKEALASLKKHVGKGVQEDPAAWQSRIREDRSRLQDYAQFLRDDPKEDQVYEKLR